LFAGMMTPKLFQLEKIFRCRFRFKKHS